MFRKIPFSCVTYLAIRGIPIITILTPILEDGKVRSRTVLLPLLKSMNINLVGTRNWTEKLFPGWDQHNGHRERLRLLQSFHSMWGRLFFSPVLLVERIQCLHVLDSETNHCCQKETENRHFGSLHEATILKEMHFFLNSTLRH